MPPLWKVKSDCYKNKQLKYECYKKLTEILKANDPDASIANTKRKINSLRSASHGPFEDSSCNRLVRPTVIHPKDYDAQTLLFSGTSFLSKTSSFVFSFFH
jgi:hypothetical protein